MEELFEIGSLCIYTYVVFHISCPIGAFTQMYIYAYAGEKI